MCQSRIDRVGCGSRVEINASSFRGGVVDQEGWNLILGNRGEGLVDGAPDTWSQVVGTNSTGDSIVIELYPSFNEFQCIDR